MCLRHTQPPVLPPPATQTGKQTVIEGVSEGSLSAGRGDCPSTAMITKRNEATLSFLMYNFLRLAGWLAEQLLPWPDNLRQ